jgi:hypothetical protein
MTSLAPRRQLPIAAEQSAPLLMPVPSDASTPAVLPVPQARPADITAPAGGRLAQLFAGLRRRSATALERTTAFTAMDGAHDPVYRHDDGGWGDDGGLD